MKDYFDFGGVRFTPKAIEFLDIQNEEERTGYFTLRNVGNRPVKITVVNPKSKFFRVLSYLNNVMLSPGLKVDSGIHLLPGAKESAEMFLVIHINDKSVFYPILVHIAAAKLYAIPTFLDFETVDLNTNVPPKAVVLHNIGALDAKFSIEVAPESIGLEIKPLRGTVQGKGHFPLDVKVPTTNVGENHLYFWIKSQDIMLIYVKVNVIKPYLEVHHPCTSGDSTLLYFPPLYYGTQYNHTLIVRNISANDNMFAVLAGVGDEIIDISRAREMIGSYKMFAVEPVEGRMKPLEGRIFTFSFKPITITNGEVQSENHFVCLSIERIQFKDCKGKVSSITAEWQKELPTCCTQDLCKFPGGVARPSSITAAPTVSTVDIQCIETEPKNMVYLFGKSLVPSVKLRPTEVIIESVPIGSTAEREVCLTNAGELAINVSFTKAPNIYVTPSHVFLKPTKSIEVLLTVKPTATGHFQQKLRFILLAKTWPTHGRPYLTEVGCVYLPIVYGSPAVTTIPKTVFSMGISPIITNEIGIVNERITFSSEIEKPRAALVAPFLWREVPPRRSRFPKQESKMVVETQEQKFDESECEILYDGYTSSSEEENANVESSVPSKHSKYCYKQKVLKTSECINDRLEESLIAFPNDRCKSLRPWPKHKIARAIFTGVRRYSSPADAQYTYANKEFLIRQEHEDFYLAYIRNLSKKLKRHRSEEKHELKQMSTKLLKWNRDENDSEDEMVPPSKDKGTAKSTDVLIPLSPLQLFNIKTSPQVLDLGKVGENSTFQKTITVHNFNLVPVQLHIIEGCSSGAEFIVQPGEVSRYIVTCCVGSLGNYKGTIEYLVNEQHSSAVPVIAQVLPKTIKLHCNSIIFPVQHAEEAFQKNTCSIGLHNDSKDAVHYVWEVAEDGAFSVTPQEGVVPAESMLFGEVLYNTSPKYLLTAELPIVSESNEISTVKCEKILRRPSISLLPHELEMGEIPLNITKMTTLFLQSSVHQPISFVVSNPIPLPGATVEPCSGILPPQGIKELQLKICFGTLLKFAFTLVIKIPGTDVSLKLPVTGQVSSPKVTIKPEFIEFGRVAAGSISFRNLTAENVGTVEADISFMFKNDSEFCISPSSNKDHCKQNECFTLQPGTSKTLKLLLIARSVSSYEFTLPVVLNGILGPPEKHNSDSLKLHTYLETNSRLYDNSMLCTTEPLETLPAISVTGTVGKSLLEFSKQEFHFILYSDDEESSHTKDNLCIQNKTAEVVSLRIDCEEFCENTPFLFVKMKGNSITRDDNSIYTTLDFDEYAIFKLAFVPELPGYYKSKATVYITDNSCKEPFCYISYDGTWMPPTLQLETSELFFPPVPLSIQLSATVEMKLLHHIGVPYITAKIAPVLDDNGWNMAETITVDFGDKGNEAEMKNGVGYIWATVSFRSEHPVSLNTVITFEDEYETKTQLQVVATADNCILTTHAFLKGHCINPNFIKTDSQEDNLNKKSCEMLSPSNQTMDEACGNPKNISSEESNCCCCKLSPRDMAGIMYYISKDNALPFPEFPPANDHSIYANHMRDALKAAEQWLRECGMHGTYGASIPEGLTIAADNTRGHKGQPQILFDLLTTLAGKNILSYFPTSELPEDNTERVHHLHRIYIHLVLFLSVQGGSIAHVRPKHLLAYGDYLVYMKSKINHLKNVQNKQSINIKILDIHKFKLLCTQSWLDIILQLQKVFSLRRITVQTVSEVSRCLKFPTPSCGSMSHRTEGSDYCAYNSEQDVKDSFEEEPIDPLTSNVYSTAECTLLAWLGAHYSAQRLQLWADSGSPPQRTVNNFSSDLQDSLVLSAVTASHCPYLIPLYLRNVLPNPTDLSQLYHNARCLCDAWEAVGLGFTVTAANIVNASPPFTVGLVAHLYEFLPGVYPQETVYFTADLAGGITHEILLQNLSKKRVTYFPRIIGDPASLFSIEYKPGPFHINASQKIKIPIKYNARKIERVKATIIFCGELSSPTPAYSMALNLEGKTVRLKENATIKISAPLYQPTDKQLKISVPYAIPDTKYDIFITHTQPTPETGLSHAQPWSKLCKSKIPQSLSIKQSHLIVTEEQHTEPLHINITCLLPTQVLLWLIFTNPRVGDFIVKLDIIPSSSIPQEFLGEKTIAVHCSCEMEQQWETSACPRVVALQIPCCNHSLWSAAVEILRNTLEPQKFKFWIQFTETKVGLLLLNWLLGQQANSVNNELSPIFNTNVTYTISTSVPKYVKVQNKVTITDTLSKGTVQLFTHIEEGASSPLMFLLTMTSKDEQEIRTYQVCVKENQSDSDIFDDPTLMQLTEGKTNSNVVKSKIISGKDISHHRK